MKLTRLLPLIFLAFAVPARGAEVRKPNVLFIVADDLRGDIGAFGNAVVKTPHMDRLAKRGVAFQRAYCQMPWCNPSRVSFLTGLRPDATRVWDLGTQPEAHLGDRAAFLPQHFKANGYWTGRVGKIYHESKAQGDRPSDPKSWDVNGGGKGAWPKGKIVEHKIIHGRGTREDFVQFTSYDVADAGTQDAAVATRGIELLAERAGKAEPWFLALGFHKPHLPFTAPQKYFDLYDATKIPLTPEPPVEEQDIPAAAGGGRSGPPVTDADRREALRAYYACISYVDAQLGRVLDELDARKLWESTIVVLIGDHGYNMGEHGGAWEKVKLWEETCRAPLLIAAPGLAGNGQPSPRIVEFTDIYPTLVDLCALPPPVQKFQGVSLRPLLADPKAKWDRPAFTQRPRLGQKGASDGAPKAARIDGRSIRTERWRYVEWNGGKAGRQLYDHAADPHEFKNLAADPAHAATTAELSKLLRDQAANDAAAIP